MTTKTRQMMITFFIPSNEMADHKARDGAMEEMSTLIQTSNMKVTDITFKYAPLRLGYEFAVHGTVDGEQE